MKTRQKIEFEAQQEQSNIFEIPPYGLRAYALFYAKHGLKQEFNQKELDWIVGESMKKKIFALLLRAGWIAKKQRSTYVCLSPESIFRKMVEFKVPSLMKDAKKEYCFTGLSAIEIWSDYSYVQRSWEKSPYFINILKRDLKYWKNFFNKNKVPNYVKSGASIGEYIILNPVEKLKLEDKGLLKVEPLKETMEAAKNNNIYLYAYNYMKEKYV